VGRPWLAIDLAKVEENSRAIVRLCSQHGIAVTGVTKGTCGSPEVARAMLRGGVASLGESRLENAARLRAAGVKAPLMLLRVPALSRVDEVVRGVDLSLDSELVVLEGLAAASRRRKGVHPVILMVDLGDLREGIWPDDLVPLARAAAKLDGLRVTGLGTNLTCYGGVVPTEEHMQRFVALVDEVERALGQRLAWLSGGSSSALSLIAAGAMPPRVNHVRIGEAILLGRETVRREPWPGTAQDAFQLHAEVVERKRKPSAPGGPRTADAFGRYRQFEDRGLRERALLDVGREDVDVEGLTPLDPGMEVLGASSDYLVVDVTQAEADVRVGDEVAFALSYGALLAAMDSAYVDKRYGGGL
jgi:predicted amino acid racemase